MLTNPTEFDTNPTSSTKSNPKSEEQQLLLSHKPSSRENDQGNDKPGIGYLPSWKQIKESTNDFLHSQFNIFNNLTTTLDNFEVNQQIARETIGVQSMFERKPNYNSPGKKRIQSLKDHKMTSSFQKIINCKSVQHMEIQSNPNYKS